MQNSPYETSRDTDTDNINNLTFTLGNVTMDNPNGITFHMDNLNSITFMHMVALNTNITLFMQHVLVQNWTTATATMP